MVLKNKVQNTSSF